MEHYIVDTMKGLRERFADDLREVLNIEKSQEIDWQKYNVREALLNILFNKYGYSLKLYADGTYFFEKLEVYKQLPN